MKGLILKDFINLKKNAKILGILTLFYAFLAFAQKSTSFFSAVFPVVFAMLTLSIYSYDEIAKWDAYGMTMPITREDMVKAKYIMMLLLSFIGTAISTTLTVVLNIVLKNSYILAGAESSAAGAAFVITFYCITLPFITKLGVEKARFIFFAVYLIPFALIIIMGKAIENNTITIPKVVIEVFEIVMKNIYVIAPLMILIILVISYMISVKIYRKKEF